MAKTAILAVKIVGDAKNGAKALGDTATKADNLFGKLKTGAAIAGAALAAATGAAVAFGTDAVKKAGDLEQSMGAIDTVFKGSAGQMHTWAKEAATNVGLTQNSFNELGTIIGTQLKNGGTAMDQLAPKTNELITLGADLSSMFGGTTADAVGALSSALKGERDPIERYGVSLKQATIDAKAAEMGFEKVGGSLSNEAQQAATLALIMEQTADAHGNFAREADTLQGKQQRLTAQLENAKTTIGTALLPAVVAVLDVFATRWMPVIENAATGIANFISGLNISGIFDKFRDGIAQASTAFAPLQTIIGSLVAWFQTSLMPVIAQVASAFVTHWTTMGTIIGGIASTLATRLAPMVPTIQAIFTTVGQIITTAGQLIASVVSVATGAIVRAWTVIGPPIITVVTTVFSAVIGIIGPALSAVKGLISAALAVLRGDWSGAWSGIVSVLSGTWNTIKAVITGGIAVFKSVISAGLTAVVALFRTIGSHIVTTVKGAATGLASAGRQLIAGFINGIKEKAAGAVRAAKDAVKGAIDAAKGILGIRSPSKVFATIGIQTGQGFIKGLGLEERAVARAGAGLVGAAVPGRLPSLEGRPRRRPGQSGPGGTTVNITINGAMDRLATAREIRRILGEYDVVVGGAA